jgi:hypothetical protein
MEESITTGRTGGIMDTIKFEVCTSEAKRELSLLRLKFRGFKVEPFSSSLSTTFN